MNKIDFVVTWVDGSDEKWLKEKNKYKADKKKNTPLIHVIVIMK